MTFLTAFDRNFSIFLLYAGGVMKVYPLFISAALLLWGVAGVIAQSNNFDISEYHQFLETHQNLSSKQLLEMHPAGLFEKKPLTTWQSALYHDSVEIKFELTDDEISLLKKNGFLVTQRLIEIS